MIALIQRVRSAHVEVAGEPIGRIERGILALIGVERVDGEKEVTRLLDKILGYRIFADDQGRMNLSLTDTNYALLLVPQFTLAADTRKGMRASFTSAADPALAESLFLQMLNEAGNRCPVASGRFGADMQVRLINDGPVTFWLQIKPGN